MLVTEHNAFTSSGSEGEWRNGMEIEKNEKEIGDERECNAVTVVGPTHMQ
jgi:hypothetical protein